MFTTWRVERIPRSNDTLTWNTGLTTTLTDYYDPLIQASIGSGKDSYEFKLNNAHGKYNNVFQPNDKINVYRKINSTSIVSTDLLMNGVIQKLPLNITSNQNLLRVEGYNYTEALMNAIVFLDATNLTIDEALKQSLSQIQAYSPQFAITWKATNPTKKKDGVTSFPIVGEKFYNKPLINLFEKYSQALKTQDGNYYFYLDNANELSWLPELTNPDYTFNTTTDLYKSMKFDKDVKDVKNFVIIKGGYGPDNTPIQTKYMDAVSVAKNGMKFYFLTDSATKAKTLNSQDMTALGITTGTLPSIALGSSYTFTTTWSSLVTGAPVVVNNDTEYCAALKAHMLVVLYNDGKTFIDSNKNGKLKIDIVFKAGKGWMIGNVIQCTIPELGYTNKNMRVQSVQYSTNEDSYSLIEDIGTI